MLKQNMRISWEEDSSVAPKPSESITKIFKVLPSALFNNKGRLHIHMPLVHGLTEGPTGNPTFLLSNKRFNKKLFPVLYNPVTVIIDNGDGKVARC